MSGCGYSDGTLKSSSPKEDYDPLTEQFSHDEDEQETEDSPSNSLGLDYESTDPYKYGVTPPVSSRAVKRAKDKSRSHRLSSKSEMREIMHQAQNQLSPHRQTWVENCSAAGENEEVKLIYTVSRRKKQSGAKSYKAIRQQERDYKHQSGCNTQVCNSVPKNNMMQVESLNHFKSLDTNVHIDNLSPSLSMSISSFPHAFSLPLSNMSCSKDRLEFIRTFNMLIRMGNKPGKVRDSRAVQLTRQLSTEQQAKYSDIIWLELRAYLNKCKVDEQDDIHYRKQLQVPSILEKVMQFKVDFSKYDASQEKAEVGAVEEESLDEVGVFPFEASPKPTCLLNSNKSESRSCSASVQSLCEGICDTNEKLEVALPQVASLLNKIEQVENLYPTLKAVAMAHSLYGRPEFQRRLSTLYLWINITLEMGNKLHYIARMLNVDTLGVDWPWVKCSPIHFLQKQGPGILSPTIYITEPSISDSESSEESIEDEDNSDRTEMESQQSEGVHAKLDQLKNVHFDVSDSGSSPPQSPDVECSPLGGHDPFLMPTDSSTPAKPRHINKSSTSVSRSSSNISFEDTTRTTIYRNYADRMLKRTGVTKLKTRLKNLLEGTLQRAKGALEKPKTSPSYASVAGIEHSASNSHLLSSSPSMDGLSHPLQPLEESDDVSTSLSAHGIWSKEFQEMRLPSFRTMYLFLVRIPFDVIHECLRLRLEQKPKKDPSPYSIGHLIKECKEILEAATNIKIYYMQMVGAVIPEEELEGLDLYMDHFEDDMERMLDVYLDYLRLYMSQLQHNNMNPISRQLRDFLEEQWKFAKGVIPYVRGGEANAAKRFCIMATSLLHSISIFLDAGMDDCINELYDISTAGLDEEMSCAKSEQDTKDSESESEGDLIDPESKNPTKRNSRSLEVRQGIFKTCRKFKNLFNEARERTAKALNFAKMLRKDLEIAAEYNISVPISDLFKKLKETGHYRVLVQQSSGYVIFIPGRIVNDHAQMLHLLNVTCGREDLLYTGKDGQQPSRPEGYMLIVRCDTCSDSDASWENETVNLESSAELTITLSHMEVESLLLVVLHSSQLAVQRKDFESQMVKAVQLAKEQISCHTIIAESIQELKKEAMCLREKVDDAIQQVEEKLGIEDFTEIEDTEITHKIQTLYRETLLRCYNFGCEYHEELLRLVSMDMRSALYPHLVTQAERWMMFAINKCEKGRGRRPKWAHTGLNFLTVAINLESVAAMPEERFTEIKDLINKCIHHVIGDKNAIQPTPYRTSSQDRNARHPYNRIQSCPSGSQNAPVKSQSAIFSKSESNTHLLTGECVDTGLKKSTSMTEAGFEEAAQDKSGGFTSNDDSSISQNTDLLLPFMFSHQIEVEFPRLSKMYQAAHALEKQLNKKLRSNKFIGRITHKNKEVHLSSLVNIRPVKFRWQRTTKIGEGRFGKVYTAVNTNTGELMAMKEMKFQTNDIQYIKKIIDEIKNLENISGHPSLVQYYGVEVHSDEIYIFMEYCPGGTLADAAKAGLPEEMIRKYTKELLVAVNVLHEHDIVHRDIKGPNVFLTVKGPLKLGDLGCAVQLKNHSTMPGEVKGMEGTAAYMAPEVFTNHEGGRSSDIWSLGCTVIEMATGKRPWPELENQFQIMYKVGMGESPAIPSNLNEEGQDFIKHCLEHEPKLRWSASRLLEHSFVKIDVSDDENDKS